VDSFISSLKTVRRTTVGLGTFITVQASARDQQEGIELLDLACSVFERVAALMHPEHGSDLAAVASAEAGERLQIDRMTWEVLAQSQQINRDSHGAFDPCLPDQPGRIVDLELLLPDVVRLAGPGCALDLGGIAKGYAIDQAIAALRVAGCISGMVNAGGDARVFGPGSHRFELRVAGKALDELELHDEAIAVSEPRSPASPPEHRGFYSPATGLQVVARPLAVRAPTAMIADALTKCAMVCASAELPRLLEKYQATLIEFG
jgi:FAD:protein FMN transferase